MKCKLCGYPGCNKLTNHYKYFCDEHEKTKHSLFSNTKRTTSGPYHNLYATQRWRDLRKEFLKKYPVCFRCGQPATIADHIVPHKGNLELFFNMENLQPMCWSCHSAKTLAENNYFKKN